MQFTFDDYVLDTSMFELRFRGSVRPIQPKPLDILHYLVLHRDRVVLKSELFSHLWPGVRVTENALVQAVALAREALADTRAPAIVSVRGRGYRFALPVVAEPVDGVARLGGSLAGNQGGFVVDAARPAELAEALDASDAMIVRSAARSASPLACFRALLAAYAERVPAARVGDRPLALALAGALDPDTLADLVVALFDQAAPRPTALVIENLERADLASALLFAVLAGTKRKGIAIIGTCAWSSIGRDTAVARILAPLAFPPLGRRSADAHPPSGRAPRYLGMREMVPVPASAKSTAQGTKRTE